MNVVLFEKDHYEGSYPVIKLFDNGQNSITIFCYEHTYRQFKFLFKENLSRYSWVVKSGKESKYAFMLRLYRFITQQKPDLVYLNTVSDNFHLYGLIVSLANRSRFILTLHTVNCMFEKKPPNTFRKWVRFNGAQFLISKTSEFNVVALTMVDYLKSKLPPSKKVHCVPGAVYEGRNDTNNMPTENSLQTISITVPGTLDSRRRNYDTVFQLLDACSVKRVKIAVTLAGGFYGESGKKIIEQCRHYVSLGHKLIFFEQSVVDQPDFDKALDDCHFIFIPTQIHTTIFDDVPERYGQTIGSGNLFDIIKHAKPSIAPRELEIDSFLKPGSFRYESVNDIVEFLGKVQTNEIDYATLQRNAIDASKNYTIEKVRERNRDIFYS